jgi:hypothetical protein
MGSTFSPEDIPQLEKSWVHMCSPYVSSLPACLIGKVDYVEVSSSPKILYMTPDGLGYSIRVNISDYNIHETIGEVKF